MTNEQFDRVETIKRKIGEIDADLKLWDSVRCPQDLGCKQHWNNDHMVELPWRHTPREAFIAYKQACENAMKAKRADLCREFEAA